MHVFGNGTYELQEATDDVDCDYYLQPHHIDLEEVDGELDEARYRCWEVVDEPFHIAVEDAAPEAAVDVAEDKGWEIVPASEAQKEYVKHVDIGVTEEPAYYIEDPPEGRYEAVGRRRCIDLLDHRGINYSDVEDSWWHPEQGKFVAVLLATDDGGNVNRMVWQSDSLNSRERALVVEGKPLENDVDERDRIADSIKQNSAMYEREAEIAACWADGKTNLKHIATWVDADITQQSVWQSIDNYTDKMQQIAWEVKHVWPHVPEDKRPDEVAEIMRTVEPAHPDRTAYETD